MQSRNVHSEDCGNVFTKPRTQNAFEEILRRLSDQLEELFVLLCPPSGRSRQLGERQREDLGHKIFLFFCLGIRSLADSFSLDTEPCYS